MPTDHQLCYIYIWEFYCTVVQHTRPEKKTKKKTFAHSTKKTFSFSSVPSPLQANSGSSGEGEGRGGGGGGGGGGGEGGGGGGRGGWGSGKVLSYFNFCSISLPPLSLSLFSSLSGVVVAKLAKRRRLKFCSEGLQSVPLVVVVEEEEEEEENCMHFVGGEEWGGRSKI